jgi:hypothetical protein
MKQTHLVTPRSDKEKINKIDTRTLELSLNVFQTRPKGSTLYSLEGGL